MNSFVVLQPGCVIICCVAAANVWYVCFVDLMLTVMEASSFTPSVYSVHALTLLAEVKQLSVCDSVQPCLCFSSHQSVTVPLHSTVRLDYASSCSRSYLPAMFRPVAIKHTPMVH